MEYYCVKLSNCDVLISIIEENLFKFGFTGSQDIDNNLLEECVSKVSSYFEDISLTFDFLHEDFDIGNFLEYVEIYEICKYCRSLIECYSYFNTELYTLCEDCFNKVNLICARIVGNDELASKLPVKMI